MAEEEQHDDQVIEGVGDPAEERTLAEPPDPENDGDDEERPAQEVPR